jgi:hypothetical protein
LVFGGLEGAGDFRVLAGVWGDAGEPAADGAGVDVDEVGEVVGSEPGLVERLAEVIVAHLLMLADVCDVVMLAVCRGKAVYASKTCVNVRRTFSKTSADALAMSSGCGASCRACQRRSHHSTPGSRDSR